ncbi:MAG: M48 family metallopeptidase [Clostridiales Family XIII bacterium]|jgi:predicted metal-dependent hydrolase|nr:M48 family metallopeptidase [Clostridiales Family XIII bacterium]
MTIRKKSAAYVLTRSRRRTLAIHIKADGSVEVRAPLKLARSEIERFVAAKSAWIAQKQAQISAARLDAPRNPPVSEYASGGFCAAVRRLVTEWERRLGVEAAFVGIRRMYSRWGSCTAGTRRIRLNAMLEYCPQECLEYVVVHELAHLRENNHSPRFWAIVAEALPDYKARQAKLKERQWVLGARGGDGR